MRLSLAVAAAACFLSSAFAVPHSWGRRHHAGGPDASGGKCGELCTTPECVIGSADLLSALNKSASPCDNFFEFACGGWIQSHPIPDSKSGFTQFNVLSDKNKATLKRILESPYSKSASVPAGQDAQDKSNFEFVQTLYKTCTNETTINAAGPAPLVALSADLDKQWPNLAGATTFVQALGVKTLFSVFVDADLVDPSVTTIYIGQDGLSLPSPEYYQDDSTLDVLHTAITTTFSLVFTDLPPSITNWTQVADRVVAFESRLANVTLPADELQDPKATYHPKPLSEFAKASPSFPWQSFLEQMFPAAQYPGLISSNTTIADQTPQFFTDFEKVLGATEMFDLELYYRWRLILNFAPSLGATWRAPITKFNQALSGAKTEPARWETCLTVVDSAIGQIEGKFFVDAAFSEASRDAVSHAIDGIKSAMVRRIPQLSWIDDATRKDAILKVDSLVRKIGFPNYTLNPTELRQQFDGLEFDNSSYFGNTVAISKWQIVDNLKKILKPVDRGVWGMTPQTVNAYYNPPLNEIVFPAGILQSPFYRAGLPSYLNYGGIGAVVGHELTHAFDNNGRQFDKDGKLRDWWTNSTSQNFVEKAQCFVNQYSNFTVTGPTGKIYNVNGDLTLGENLADVGGLNRAYEAWKADTSSDNSALPGLESYTPEQLFFLNYAQVWCGAVRPAAQVQRLLTDPHSPNNYRVLGAIQDTPAFKDAFGCKAPSPVCALW
ncbi:zincin [Gonapodya prolifera JEL478]|uniref:Zincin n=1 Tax=Gonapodya prolifera (strain JEL478) TaxID=1344416 RepID=A0A139ATP7_GONPJ|nr:zincin [Gonapodya prolifera JEL478]|eukprot:KXS20101.1 zincin [Gonapodya prolifera JEL478]